MVRRLEIAPNKQLSLIGQDAAQRQCPLLSPDALFITYLPAKSRWLWEDSLSQRLANVGKWKEYVKEAWSQLWQKVLWVIREAERSSRRSHPWDWTVPSFTSCLQVSGAVHTVSFFISRSGAQGRKEGQLQAGSHSLSIIKSGSSHTEAVRAFPWENFE